MKTMRDVAQRAGVSSTTVSLVLNGRQPGGGSIPAETQQRVLAAAKELGYRRNALAQAVISGHNRALGFLAGGIEYEFIARVLGGALDEAGAADYAVQLLRLQSNSLDRQAIERCLEMRLAGVLTMDMSQESLDYLHAEMKPLGVLIAFIDTSFSRDWGIHVVTDDKQGCHLAVEHLAQLGHRRIAFIGGRTGQGMAVIREQAYHHAMREHSLEVREDYVRQGGWSVDVAQQAALELLRLPERPTAIFCASDDMAIGAQRAARSVGLQMPRDLSVVGYANQSIAYLADPPLTTIAQPMEEMGRVATRLILEKLREGQDGVSLYDEPVEEILPTHLVLRNSTTTPSEPR